MPSASSINSNNINISKLDKQLSLTCGGGAGRGNSGNDKPQKSASQSVSDDLTGAAAGAIVAVDAASTNSEASAKEQRGSISGASGVAVSGNGVGSGTHLYNPMKQAIITIEHKIRNLEKRKTKLDTYRVIQASGKELSNDQKAAVAKYDGVLSTLEFAREFSKQMVQFSKENEKEQKKQLRKETVARAQAETAKIREVLVIQNILTCFTDDAVRSDFLNGENGAIKLQPTDVDVLGHFCNDIQTRRPELPDDATFVISAQKAAENFSLTIDGRPRQYGDTTYDNLRRIFQKIQKCGYLDKLYLVKPEPISANDEVGDSHLIENAADDGFTIVTSRKTSVSKSTEKLEFSELENNANDMSEQRDLYNDRGHVMLSAGRQHPNHNKALRTMQQQLGIQAPPASALPNFQAQRSSPPVLGGMHVPMFGGQPAPPPQMQGIVPSNSGMLSMPPAGGAQMVGMAAPARSVTPSQQQRQLMTSPGGGPLPGSAQPQPGLYNATTVRAVEQGILRQHQYMQQMRPLSEVIGGGSFYFLQDSELDSPDLGGAINGMPSVPYDHDEMQRKATPEHLLQQQTPPPLAATPQPISTRTFTNQSFPSLQAAGGSAGQQNAGRVTPTNAFQQQQQQHKRHLYSPALQQQLLQQQQAEAVLLNADQQVAAAGPMMIIPRMAAPQARLSRPQQQQQQLDAGFHYDNTVVSALNYEQQVQQAQQFAAAAAAAAAAMKGLHHPQRPASRTSAGSPLDEPQPASGGDELQHALNAFGGCRPASNNNNSALINTATLAHVLKPTAIDATAVNKWSSAEALPQLRKHEWSTTSETAVGTEAAENSTQWSTAVEREERESGAAVERSSAGSGGAGGGGGGGGYGRGGHRGNYQRRDRRTDDDRRAPGGGGGNGGYRGRGNYNSSTQQNGGGSRGMFYRNNNDGGGGNGGASYYQNVGGSGGGGFNRGEGGSRYEGGGGSGNYRGRGANGGNNGGGNSTRGNNNGGGAARTPNSRNASGANAGSAGGAGGGGSASAGAGAGAGNGNNNNGSNTSSSAFLNSRQQTQRAAAPATLGLETKN